MRPRRADDDFVDFDLDEILEVDEDEFEPVDEMELEGDEFADEEEEFECPPGCVAADEEEDEEDEEEGEEKEEEGEDEEKEDEKEETEASVKGMWAALYDETDVQNIRRDAEVVMLYHDSEDPHYVVVADGRPVGEIKRSDLITDENTKSLFSTEEFPQHVIAAVDQLGFANVMPDLNIRYYAAQVTEKAAAGKAAAIVSAGMSKDIQVKLAELKTNFVKNVKLAVEASMKNVVMDNPLRDAMRAKFKGAGVPDAVIVDLFEDAMQESGDRYFQAAINQADEWLGLTPEAMVEVEKMIHKAGYVPAAERLEIDPFIPQRKAAPVMRTMAAPRDAAPVDEFEHSASAIKRGLLKSGTATRGTRR
jgi:hypothetical protein